MLKYIFKRLLIFVPTLFVIITVSFFLIKIAPGSPFDTEKPLPPAVRANIMKAYKLDSPLYIQYLDYLKNILKGDFGPSLKIKDFTVNELIYRAAPVSLKLGLISIIFAFFSGVFLGSIAALNANRPLDYIIMSLSMIGIIVPNYALAPLLMLVFAIYLKIFPVAGWQGPSFMVLPVFALSLPYLAYIARLTRGSMLEVLNTNYIRTAYAKGLSNNAILFKHALKPAVLPVVSYLGPAIAGIITGSVVIEGMFDIPGLGRYFVQSSLNRDYPLVMGLVIFYAFIIIIMNLVVDVMYAWLDPKISYD